MKTFKQAAALAFLLTYGGGILGAEMAPSFFMRGIEAYKERRWVDAMGDFVEALREDPKNALAHKYLDAITQEISTQNKNRVEHQRLAYLEGAVESLKGRPQQAQVNAALTSVAGAEDQKKEKRWLEKLEQARTHKELGQLLPANDLVLQVLAEKSNHQEALRELSDLQSRLRQALNSPTLLALDERYAYEGFYAYGQADYAGAATAWNKARALVNQIEGNQRMHHLKALYFDAYANIAQAHVDADKQQDELRAIFAQGVAAFNQGRFEEALETFRKLALRDPEYPQLAFYLIQAETGAEKMRAKRLGEEKRREIVNLYEKGVVHLEKERFDDAERCFMRVLTLDPTHSQARAYLAMAKAENARRHDPKAAQMHYETGLIAYASGKLDEALREWKMAIRMNPGHVKAKVALSKVQKELALNSELPDIR